MNSSRSVSLFPRRHLGFEYEKQARAFLEEKGYQILKQNQNYPWGEIDLIAEFALQSGPVLIFVEVRGAREVHWVRPEESITPSKRRRLYRAIESYLMTYRGQAQQMRLDLVTILGDEIKHFPNFFDLFTRF